MKKKYFPLFLLVALALFGLVGYNTENNKVDHTLFVGGDYMTGNSLDNLVDNSTLIVVGEYLDLEETWNMSRDRENPELESTEHYYEGHLYNFRIDEIVYGTNSENEILVNLAYKEAHKFEENGNEVNFEMIDPYYVEPEQGVKYMLFLNKDEMFGNYYGAIEPFQVKIDGNEQVHLISNQVLSDNLPENSEIHDDGVYFKTLKEHQNKQIEVVTEVPLIKDFIEGSNLEQLKNQVHNLTN